MSEKTFSDRWQQLDWDDLTLQLNSKTTRDVERALSADTLTTTDFMALISPAARPYLEIMAQKAQTLTRQRFGHVVGMYVPLYLSNLCANDCTYCGFSMSNHIKRKTLTPEEIHTECKAIKALGFDSLLLVTGEHQRKVGMDGISKIGLGALIGLSGQWRTDCYMVAEHLHYLRQRYWKTRYSISFPRLRPCAGGIEPESLMNETELVQLICAFRLFAPDTELSLSTRESPYFRDHMVPVAINQVSAGSRTQPGGYAEEDDPELEQFSPHDNRSPQQVADALLAAGLQPVWKDWDKYLGR